VVDNNVLRANNWKLPAEPEPESEEQDGQQPVAVDVAYNVYEERNGKTIALKLSFQLPLQ
jgi:hypothetical protein